MAQLGDPELGTGLPGKRPIPPGSGHIEQAVIIPDSASATLHFTYQITTYDVMMDRSGRLYDFFEVTVSGKSIFQDGNKVPGTSQKRNDLPWKTQSLDVSPWRGERVILRFSSWNGYDQNAPGRDTYNTWTYLDEIEVTQ